MHRKNLVGISLAIYVSCFLHACLGPVGNLENSSISDLATPIISTTVITESSETKTPTSTSTITEVTLTPEKTESESSLITYEEYIQSTPTIDLSEFFGEWMVVEHVIRHPDSEYLDFPIHPDELLGETILIAENSLSTSEKFFSWHNYKCQDQIYRWAHVIGSSGQALLDTDHPEKGEQPVYFYDVICDGGLVMGFEVSASGKLIMFWYSNWYFLERINQ